MPIVIQRAAALSAASRLAAALLPLLGFGALVTVAGPVRASEPLAFTVPAEDGYGIGDCMQAGSACGQAMANSWCEAHGHIKAVAFGSAADVTGAIGSAAGAAGSTVEPGDVLIRCGD